MPFVPDAFAVPAALDGGWCRLRPLAVADNEQDFAAWQSSVEHIAATPGYEGRSWPLHEYRLEQNQDDLAEHVADFAARRGFTYTVLHEGDGETIGCVYVYPPEDGDPAVEAEVRSWVRADHAERDADLYRLVTAWVDADWPFATVRYAPRD
jgi:hypothetical protein